MSGTYEGNERWGDREETDGTETESSLHKGYRGKGEGAPRWAVRPPGRPARIVGDLRAGPVERIVESGDDLAEAEDEDREDRDIDANAVRDGRGLGVGPWVALGIRSMRV